MSQTVSFTVSDAEAARIAKAIGDYSNLGVGVSATPAQIKTAIANWVIATVAAYEAKTGIATAVAQAQAALPPPIAPA